jgi:hypothetical protein
MIGLTWPKQDVYNFQLQCYYEKIYSCIETEAHNDEYLGAAPIQERYTTIGEVQVTIKKPRAL